MIIPSTSSSTGLNAIETPCFPGSSSWRSSESGLRSLVSPVSTLDFVSQHGSVFLRPTRDLLELASVIAASRLFAGNQGVAVTRWRKR